MPQVTIGGQNFDVPQESAGLIQAQQTLQNQGFQQSIAMQALQAEDNRRKELMSVLSNMQKSNHDMMMEISRNLK